jgi:hypothetical protein
MGFDARLPTLPAGALQVEHSPSSAMYRATDESSTSDVSLDVCDQEHGLPLSMACLLSKQHENLTHHWVAGILLLTSL